VVNKLYKTHLSAPCILGKYKVKIYIKSSKSVKKVSCRNAFCASFFAIYFAIAFFFRKKWALFILRRTSNILNKFARCRGICRIL